jgi:hypothetical protein
MISRSRGNTSRLEALVAVSSLALALSGCVGVPGLEPEGGPTPIAAASPERAAAVAEIRAQAQAGDAMAFPDAYQSAQTARLALREEPRSIAEVQAIEAELTLIAEQRAATSDAREIAALDAKAKELRRLAMAAQTLRR